MDSALKVHWSKPRGFLVSVEVTFTLACWDSQKFQNVYYVMQNLLWQIHLKSIKPYRCKDDIKDIAQSRMCGIFIRVMTCFIVIQWRMTLCLLESPWNMSHPVWKCLDCAFSVFSTGLLMKARMLFLITPRTQNWMVVVGADCKNFFN